MRSRLRLPDVHAVARAVAATVAPAVRVSSNRSRLPARTPAARVRAGAWRPPAWGSRRAPAALRVTSNSIAGSRSAASRPTSDVGVRVPLRLMLNPQHESLHAAIAVGQIGAQVIDQPTQREQQGGVAVRPRSRVPSGVEMIGWLRSTSCGSSAFAGTGGPDVRQQLGPEAPAQAVTRQLTQGANVAHAHREPAFASPLSRAAAARRTGTRSSNSCIAGAGGHRQAIAQPASTRAARGRGRHRDAMGESEARSSSRRLRFDAWPRAKQPETAHALPARGARPLRADQRAVAIRPCGEELLPARFGLRLVFSPSAWATAPVPRSGACRPAARPARAWHSPHAGCPVARVHWPAPAARPGIRQTPEDGVQRQLRQHDAGPQHARGSMHARRGTDARGCRAAAAFAHAPAIAIVLRRSARRRRIAPRACGRAGEAQAVPAVRRDLQPAQGLCVRLPWPADHHRAAAAAQALLERPQRIARRGFDDVQHAQVDTGCLPRRRIRQVGRRDHHVRRACGGPAARASASAGTIRRRHRRAAAVRSAPLRPAAAGKLHPARRARWMHSTAAGWRPATPQR